MLSRNEVAKTWPLRHHADVAAQAVLRHGGGSIDQHRPASGHESAASRLTHRTCSYAGAAYQDLIFSSAHGQVQADDDFLSPTKVARFL
jgi:hypothetical protein